MSNTVTAPIMNVVVNGKICLMFNIFKGSPKYRSILAVVRSNMAMPENMYTKKS